MLQFHHFNVGRPDNLVHVDAFLDTLRQRLECMQCLYCGKVFRDRLILKSHMRKKRHYKINALDEAFDRFYIVNYTVVRIAVNSSA